jgi:AAA domain-containing protein
MITFRPAIRENVGLILGMIGPSGGGKTYTAMRLASGICADKPFAVIDTENGRAKHYAGMFKFDHGDLAPPFRPDAYADAILAADKGGYPVIVVDSCSHEWAGDGGILDWQEEELDRLAGDDHAKRERVKLLSWNKPKTSHKAMVQKLLRVKAHLILCFRAEEKIEMVKGKDGKIEIVPKRTMTGLEGWIPICEKSLPYELTASFLLLPSAPGIPHPIKLQEQHRALFPLDKPITEESGMRLAVWAKGGLPPPKAIVTHNPPHTDNNTLRDPLAGAMTITQDNTPPDPLFVKAREMAESGIERYQKWFLGLSKDERHHIGAERHDAFKALAAKVPT